jgi:hypothetical protein
MLEAHIVSRHGSLYFAAEATPYDLEILRLHVAALAPDRAGEVRLDVAVDGAAATPALARWLRRLTEAGVRVRGNICVRKAAAPTSPAWSPAAPKSRAST